LPACKRIVWLNLHRIRILIFHWKRRELSSLMLL
jgi:hypothetical protein